MVVTMAKPTLVRLAGVELSDHNRSALAIAPERIEKKIRTANGSLRKYHVADKLTFSMSWEMLPLLSSQTVDGKGGAVTIRNIYVTNKGPMSFDIRNHNGTTSTFTVMFVSCNWTIVKRWDVEYRDVDISLEEV